MLTIGAVHSGATSLAPLLDRALAPLMDDYTIINVIDDSLIARVMADGEVGEDTNKRVLCLCEALVLAGADVVVETCSSVGEAADLADRVLPRPVFRIDRPMAEMAAAKYAKIGVLATLPHTLGPTARCVEESAARLHRQVDLIPMVAPGAFDRFLAGDAEGHRELLLKAARSFRGVEAILLAQASMSTVRQTIADETGLEVFSSPECCAERLCEMRRAGNI